jgi:predicted RNA binding protein YcfA (HicA-like mRNA interferase family)
LGKLRVLSAREVCQILEQHGFVVDRQRGSHIIMQKRTEELTITVPVPNYSESRLFVSQAYLDICLRYVRRKQGGIAL